MVIIRIHDGCSLYTLQKFNISMDSGPFIDFWLHMFLWFHSYMLDYQRVVDAYISNYNL